MVVHISDPVSIIHFASYFTDCSIHTDSEMFSDLKALIEYNGSDLESSLNLSAIDWGKCRKIGVLQLPKDRVVKRKFQVVDSLDAISKRLIFWHKLTIYIGPVERYNFSHKKLSRVSTPNLLETAQWVKHARNIHLTNPVNIALAKCLDKKIL
jgi:hypothetical protein